MSSTWLDITLAECLAWLAGAELSLLRHAYPDRTRFVSLGLSVAAAAGVAGAGVATACGLALGSLVGWLVFPLATAGFGLTLRWLLAWAWQGHHFGRRLGLVAAGLFGAAWLIAWPLQHHLLQVPADTAAAATLRSLRWAIHLVVMLVLLIPAYATAAASRSPYARAAAARRTFEHLFSA